MTLSTAEVIAKSMALKSRYAQRDARYADVTAVRSGNYTQAAPDMFPSDVPQEIVANFVDTAARDLSEVIAPLPSFNCTSSNMVSDAARTKADKRSKICAYYVTHSRLQQQMFAGADHYLTYSFLPLYVEPDFETKCPRVTVESPVGGYPEFDRWGRVKSYAKWSEKTVGELCSEWPEHATAIRGTGQNTKSDGARVQMVRYTDDEVTVLFLPTAGMMRSVELARVPNPLGECPVKVARRPQWDAEMRGQWDSVIWVQVARARMAQLAWEAGEKSVQAPIVATPDMQDFAFGPDSILYSQNPEKVRRLPIEIPQSAFAELSQLGNEQRLGARYPEGRTGNMSASVVTGRGVQELLAGFDTQVKTAQENLVALFEDVLALCFKMDEALWPTVEKTVRGTQNDAPYEVKYRAAKDIAGNHTVDVVYGFAAGMDPNRATVMLLQLQGAGAISTDFMLRQMPFNINPTDEHARIEIENLRKSVLAGIDGLAQSAPQMVLQGQDPTSMIAKIADVIKRREQGEMVEDAFNNAFAPPKQPPAPDGAAPPGAAPGPGDGAGLPPATATGGMGGAAGGSSGPPDLQQVLSTLTASGAANAKASVMRTSPI